MRELTGGTKIRLSQIKGLKEWRERLALDKEDANGMEHSDNNGQFVSKGLADNIDTILHGTKKEKEALRKRFFTLVNETPPEYKDIGLKGDNICVQYGKISHHKGKDDDHYFSADEWRQICKNLSDPKKCIITRSAGRKDFNVYTKIGKSVMVGVELKHPQQDEVSNNLKTIFRRDVKETESVLYPKDLKKLTPAQRSLLTGRIPSVYTADRRSIIIIDHTPEVVNSIRNLFYSILNEATIA